MRPRLHALSIEFANDRYAVLQPMHAGLCCPAKSAQGLHGQNRGAAVVFFTPSTSPRFMNRTHVCYVCVHCSLSAQRRHCAAGRQARTSGVCCMFRTCSRGRRRCQQQTNAKKKKVLLTFQACIHRLGVQVAKPQTPLTTSSSSGHEHRCVMRRTLSTVQRSVQYTSVLCACLQQREAACTSSLAMPVASYRLV